MAQFAFAPGTHFRWGELPYVIQSVTDEQDVELEGKAGSFRHTTLTDLYEGYVAGDIVFVGAQSNAAKPGSVRAKRTLSDFTPKQQADAIRARNYIERLRASGPIVIDTRGEIEARLTDVANDLGDADPPDRSTLWRWMNKFDASGGDPLSLVPRYDERGGRNRRRRHRKVAEIEDRLVDEMYLQRNGDSVRSLHSQVELEVRRENQWRSPDAQLVAPSESALRRQISRLDQLDVLSARIGTAEANRRLRANKEVPLVTRKLERVELDSTPLDLFVIDTETNVAWGRPTLYVGIDRKTRYPWGMNVGYGDCSSSAALACVAHGIKPKSYLKRRYPELTSAWLAHGVPAAIRVDNGNELHSRAMRDAAYELGFDVEFCPKRQPNWKGSIERFFKTVNFSLMHTLPGTSLAKYWHRKDYDPLKAAVVDMNTLLKILHLWMVDIYPREFHRGLGMSPLKAWKLSK